MNKLLFYDLETTGTKFWKNSIHQIGGMIVIDDSIKEEFNFKVAPFERAEIEDEALAVSGVTKEQIMAYPSMAEVHKSLTGILANHVDKFNKNDKFHLVGYNNSSFDNPFLRAFFVQCKDNYFGSWFWSDTIDCMVLASNALRQERSKMLNFKLHTVAKQLGIEVDETKLHDAVYDLRLTKEIFDLVS